MRGLCLRKCAVGLFLDGVDDVGEFDGILNKEDRDIVSHDVPVALLSVEFNGKAANISRKVNGSLATRDCREPDKCRSAFALALKQIGPGVFRKRLVILKKTMSPIAASMHNALRNALVVKVENLLSKMEVLNQRRPAWTDL